MEGVSFNLGSLRDEIDSVDRHIIELLNQRYRLVQQIGKWKRDHGIPVLAPEREKALLEKLSGLNQGPMDDSTLRSIYREIIAGSYLLENELVNKDS